MVKIYCPRSVGVRIDANDTIVLHAADRTSSLSSSKRCATTGKMISKTVR